MKNTGRYPAQEKFRQTHSVACLNSEPLLFFEKLPLERNCVPTCAARIF